MGLHLYVVGLTRRIVVKIQLRVFAEAYDCIVFFFNVNVKMQTILLAQFKDHILDAAIQFFAGFHVSPTVTDLKVLFIRFICIVVHGGKRQTAGHIGAVTNQIEILGTCFRLYIHHVQILNGGDGIGVGDGGYRAILGQGNLANFFITLTTFLRQQIFGEMIAIFGGQLDHMHVGLAGLKSLVVFFIQRPLTGTAPSAGIPLLTGEGAVIVNRFAGEGLHRALCHRAMINQRYLVDVGIVSHTRDGKGIPHGDRSVLLRPLNNLIGVQRRVRTDKGDGGVVRKCVAVVSPIRIVGVIRATRLKLITNVKPTVFVRRDHRTVFIVPRNALPRAVIRLTVGNVGDKADRLHTGSRYAIRRHFGFNFVDDDRLIRRHGQRRQRQQTDDHHQCQQHTENAFCENVFHIVSSLWLEIKSRKITSRSRPSRSYIAASIRYRGR